MSTEITASAWVAEVLKAQKTKQQKAGYAGTKNGNVTGTFAAPITLVSGHAKYEIPAGTEFCVFGPMGGVGTAATIFDYTEGHISLMQNGRVKRRPLPSSTLIPPRNVRMSVPLGIG